MDLLTTVRKEGSRGGRGDFKWSDVQSSSHRENYLGHSLMAPVGRWQKGRDLNWYAKGDTDQEGEQSAAERAAQERREEIRRIKEAEQDALARALGYDVPPRNPNLESLGDMKDVDQILKEAAEDDDTETGKGVGYGKFGASREESDERIQGDDFDQSRAPDRSRKDTAGRARDSRRHKNRSRSRDHDRDRRRRQRNEDDSRRRSRSRSRDRKRRRRSTSRERRHHVRGDRERREHRRSRSRSPYHREWDDRRDGYKSRRR